MVALASVERIESDFDMMDRRYGEARFGRIGYCELDFAGASGGVRHHSY